MSQARAASDSRDRVGPYVLVKAIGAGGSARVDLARIERAYGFQRHVVIKRPLEHLRGDARAAEGLRREARLGARLRHPNLVAILDAGVHDGYDYLVLDYVHGGSLRTLMQTDDAARVQDVPQEVALAIVRDAARGVHEAHELTDAHGAPLGLVHRDVSPGNVLVGLDGAVKLADFGIAKETRVATLSGSMHGTVTYMAPEQCRGHAFDRRADVFSLGVILYELATGARLFWADNDVASLHRVLAGTITRPRKVRATILPELEDIIMTAVAHEQDKRFPTARALADALELYGSTHGQILASRCVSRWVENLLGPRDAPWIGTDTVIQALPPEMLETIEHAPEPMPEVSLVALIEAAPIDEAPPPATFGPTDAAMFEDVAIDTERTAQPAGHARGGRKRGALIAALLGGGLAVGGITAVVTSRNDAAPAAQTETSPAAAPAAAPIVDTPPAPVIEQEEPAGVAAEAPTDASEPSVDEADVVIDDTPREPVKRRTRPKGKTEAAKVDPKVDAKTDPKNPNVKWDPGMLLPTDETKPKKTR